MEAVELVCDGLFRFTHLCLHRFAFRPFLNRVRLCLLRLDASMVSNDHNYFVFEDLLHDVGYARLLEQIFC